VPLIPPAITTQPLSQTVAAGGTVSFSVEASGSQPLRYQWRRNGGNIAGATNAYYGISNVQTIQAGSYTVVVSNARASVTSANAVLTVIVPPAITAQPQSQVVTAGNNVSLFVTASGTSPLSYQWYRNNSPIASATTSNYSISGVQPTNAGDYKVRVSNAAGTVDSTNATLTVHYAPVIVSQPLGQMVIAGSSIGFSVIADGVPSPTYQWHFNNSPIPGANSPAYTVASAQPSNAGSYKVVVSNARGSVVSDTANLVVPAPSFLTISRPGGGLVQLTITGTVGAVYSIEYVSDLVQTNGWRCLDLLQLAAAEQSWIDPTVPVRGQRFYRVAVTAPKDMVFIQPGTFTMGSPANELDRSPDEGPQTTVTLSRGFWMGKCEVTQREYQAVVGSNPSQFSGDLSRPVETVSWHDATNYCGLLTQRERAAGLIPMDFEYRLPTEAEWEYACRAGTTTRFSYGEDPGYTNLNKYAWYLDNGGGATHPVGQRLLNTWGLYDMHGNVWEWCQDRYGRYSGGIALDPQGPGTGSSRVVRGGSWVSGNSSCRSARRLLYEPGQSENKLGFRVVLVPRAAVPEDMVFIQPGTFTMGSPANEVDRGPDEGPQTAVTLSRGFWMGKCEVTQREYQAVVGSNPSHFSGDLSRPVETVSWQDATNYCGLLTQRDRAAGLIPMDFEYRLPTEAEWEYACRAGTTTRYSHGEDPGYTELNSYAWFGDNSGGTTHPVGQKLPNRWGLYDMHGNVLEWCQDWYGDYCGGSTIDPQGAVAGSYRVLRGGNWVGGGAGGCRSANRAISGFAGAAGGDVGFRVVLVHEP